MANERNTEQAVLDLLLAKGYRREQIEFQKSSDKDIQGLLTSKSAGTQGRGYPEFIVKLRGIASDLLVIECKADRSGHATPGIAKAKAISHDSIRALSKEARKNFAEDGVLHYMKDLSAKFNVIGLAVSGEEGNLELSTFLQKRGEAEIKRLPNDALLPASDYNNLLKNNGALPLATDLSADIAAALPEIHIFLRDEMELSEQDKPLVISAILLALTNEAFSRSWATYANGSELAGGLLVAIENTLKHARVNPAKVERMMDCFSCVKDDNVRKHLVELVRRVDGLFSGIDFAHTSYDLAGAFYNEFLKYTGGDKQGLGIVLTPRHITDLFTDLAELTKDSVVIDTCTGTAGFLIAAMNRMVELAHGDQAKIAEIKKNQLIGVEFKKDMFVLACSNMILRNDGQANMFNMSCFDLDERTVATYDQVRQANPGFDEIDVLRELETRHGLTREQSEGAAAYAKIKKLPKAPTACLINPPYSKSKADYHELRFIQKGLDLLAPGGKMVAIVPVSCAIESTGATLAAKKDLMKHHTLEAVLSMPDGLFPMVGTITCIMVFKAKQPHQKHSPVFFGYYKEDDFKALKTARVPVLRQAVDKAGQLVVEADGSPKMVNLWEEVRRPLWLKHYYAKTANVPGLCRTETGITPESEWLCEAYMETDFSQVDTLRMVGLMKSLNAYLYENNFIADIASQPYRAASVDPIEARPKYHFRYADIFDITKPHRLASFNSNELLPGDVPLVSATERNNGVSNLFALPAGKQLTPGNVITVSSNGSVGEAFYQVKPFGSTQDINILALRGHTLDPFLAIYMMALIRAEKPKYNYGRKWGKERMRESVMELPITGAYSAAQLDTLLSSDYLGDIPAYLSNVAKADPRLQVECDEIAARHAEMIAGKPKDAFKNTLERVEGLRAKIASQAIDFDYMRDLVASLHHSEPLRDVEKLLAVQGAATASPSPKV